MLFGISTMVISCEISCQNPEMSDVCVNNQSKWKIRKTTFFCERNFMLPMMFLAQIIRDVFNFVLNILFLSLLVKSLYFSDNVVDSSV